MVPVRPGPGYSGFPTLRCAVVLATAHRQDRCRGGELPTADIHRSQGYTQYTQGQCQLFRKCARHRTGTPRRRAAVLQAAASTASSGMLIGRLFRAATCQGPSWAGTRANGVQKGRQGSFLAACWRSTSTIETGEASRASTPEGQRETIKQYRQSGLRPQQRTGGNLRLKWGTLGSN